MKLRTLVLAAAIAPSLLASSAFAQTATSSASSIQVTSSPVTGSVSPGSSVALGTVTFSSPGGSFTVSSVPVTLSPGGAGLAGNLTNCQLFNTNSVNNATTTGALGSSINPVNGSNSFALSSPLTVNSGNPVTLQIRCDVSSSAPSGSTFQFLTSTSTSIGSPATGASLSAEVDFVKQVPAGLNNAIIGVITLDATHSNQDITLSAVPISVSASGGATLSALTNCVITSTTGTVLTTGGNAVAGVTGSNSFTLDAPLTVKAGGGSLLVLRCNVSSQVPVGSTITVGLSPTSFQAKSAGGSPVTVMQGVLSTGQPGTNSGVVTIGPVGSSSTGVGSPSNPGIPNTGAGGEAVMTFSILAASLIVMGLAMRSLMRTR